jgi:hypothetical protein
MTPFGSKPSFVILTSPSHREPGTVVRRTCLSCLSQWREVIVRALASRFRVEGDEPVEGFQKNPTRTLWPP